jgi:hypothetical protein
MGVSTTQIKKLIERLQETDKKFEEWIAAKEETQGNEEGRDYPNQERLDKLQAQIDVLSEAKELLEPLITCLEDYENA